MKTLVCYLNMFELNQKLYLFNDNAYELIDEMPIEDLIAKTTFNCEKNNINHIHLFGDENFLDPYIKELIKYGKTYYNLNDLIVEVN